MLIFKILRCFVLSCFLFVGLVSTAQNSGNKVYYFAKDSLPNDLIEQWRYFPGDSMTMSAKDYNDQSWQSLEPRLDLDRVPSGTFKGIGWFRFHFRLDSSVIGKPLAISARHYGASEIYLDGKLMKKFGVIKDSAHCVYNDPQELPFVFTITDTGIHVLAIRYANYKAAHNHTFYHVAAAGFKISFGPAEDLILKRDYRSLIVTFVFILLAGIFLVLCILHLLLYLFYPITKSNLFFSLFMLSLSSLSLIGYFSLLVEDPLVQLNGYYLVNLMLCLGCVSLSIFINELFFKKKGIRFWLIIGIGVISVLMRYFDINLYGVATIILIITVSFEAAITIIIAIFKKIKGARIIGWKIR